MEVFKHNAKVDFLKVGNWTFGLSIIVAILSTYALFQYGLNMGLDFSGGTQIQLSYAQDANLKDMRKKLSDGEFDQAMVQNYGTSKEVLVNIPHDESVEQGEQVKQILALLPGATVKKVDFVGPQVGKELMSKGLLAIIISVIFTMIYIAMRFEYRLAACSTVALAHDPLFILGVFAYWQLEFDIKALAALLAVIGYSLNDTIVVFDRVRENFKKFRRMSPEDVMNSSINQTLSRTIITSVLTLIVVTALYIYGGESLRGFSLTMILGVIVGTYSSIFIAGALAIRMGLSRADIMPKPKAAIDDRP